MERLGQRSCLINGTIYTYLLGSIFLSGALGCSADRFNGATNIAFIEGVLATSG